MVQRAYQASTPVLVALGSNLGDRVGYLNAAVQMIAATRCIENIRSSPIYETEPVGYTNQPRFLNCCIIGSTLLDPIALHSCLKHIEQELGRRSRPRWHEREIDLDIILYGRYVLHSAALTIPHPSATERAFVLLPACDIAADWIHPLTGKTIGELATPYRHTDQVRKTEFCIKLY
ncbi:MAG: 2-amino-4-hydroxy-6-hydroxymethyldihydropteridine diphosphokinase [Bacteroidota bacterium]|nr:2-amino-4-hydroxy-6-hydroxymethyldihydropteridine diphosphokinase [Candidatus Kapabacteria bacterium]MCS7302457.1 2-amino-4-hydroxy-6-hydroxymethyldihydropteridine diphosphokinase [Candidatus Kapabacteria bacterium]MCX7936346.1 2-amino-4-hydroxy-6-hydroxymethyldihydropteridine diphosphokinase [Chlorobiota bacterium]MDW8074373.1 2-amino-4-hydroxy-6-hydroxymethyldihydropteridine diphosphokinase [Bacteroidota bacterium]MDW8271151.1 2-amino-4-hydroxy-6-hydroxymethyldihydropteridine diphosphokina